MTIDAVILAGGKGTRLQSVVNDRPKPMALIAGRPFLEWLLLVLRQQGVKRAVLCTGYLSEMIENHFQGRFLDMEIVCSLEVEPLGTAGCIRHALPHVQSNPFLALNGDSYCRIALSQLWAQHQAKQSKATLQLMPVEDCRRYGSVELSVNQTVTAFREKTAELHPGLISAGIYLLDRHDFAQLSKGQNLSIERDYFPLLIGKGLYGYIGDGPFIDIGTPESYQSAAAILHEELARLEQQAQTPQTQKIAHFSQAQLRTRADLHLRQSAEVMQLVADRMVDEIMVAANLIADTFRNGNKLLLCGNGGSAADCQHVAAEFVSRLTKDFERPALPAIALTTDSSFLTAYANDLDFAGVFERQVEALGKAGDLLIGISTSGNSVNVIKAIHAAHARGMKTLVLVGEGGQLSELATCPLVIPSRNTQYIQEASLAIEHILCDLSERMLFA